MFLFIKFQPEERRLSILLSELASTATTTGNEGVSDMSQIKIKDLKVGQVFIFNKKPIDQIKDGDIGALIKITSFCETEGRPIRHCFCADCMDIAAGRFYQIKWQNAEQFFCKTSPERPNLRLATPEEIGAVKLKNEHRQQQEVSDWENKFSHYELSGNDCRFVVGGFYRYFNNPDNRGTKDCICFVTLIRNDGTMLINILRKNGTSTLSFSPSAQNIGDKISHREVTRFFAAARKMAIKKAVNEAQGNFDFIMHRFNLLTN